MRVLPPRSQSTMGTIDIGQATQFLVEQGLQILPEVLFRHSRFGHLGHLSFPALSSGGCRPCLQRGLVSDPVEPVGQQLPGSEGCRFADEDQESGLKGVLGVVVMGQHTSADGPDHRSVTPNEDRQGGFIMAVDVALQQLPIAQASAVSKHRLAKALENLIHLAVGHVSTLMEQRSPLPVLLPAQGRLIHDFVRQGQPRRHRLASFVAGLIPHQLRFRFCFCHRLTPLGPRLDRRHSPGAAAFRGWTHPSFRLRAARADDPTAANTSNAPTQAPIHAP